MFEEDRLLSSIRSVDWTLSAEQISMHLREDLRKFVNGAPQADDITIVTIKYLGPDEGQVSLD
jgi:serine phosphatase RsbU (regulator of sigma subunit)